MHVSSGTGAFCGTPWAPPPKVAPRRRRPRTRVAFRKGAYVSSGGAWTRLDTRGASGADGRGRRPLPPADRAGVDCGCGRRFRDDRAVAQHVAAGGCPAARRRVRILYAHGLEAGPGGFKVRALGAWADVNAPNMEVSLYNPFPANSLLRNYVLGGFDAGAAARASLAGCVAIQERALAAGAHTCDVLVASSWGGAVALALLASGSWAGPAAPRRARRRRPRRPSRGAPTARPPTRRRPPRRKRRDRADRRRASVCSAARFLGEGGGSKKGRPRAINPPDPPRRLAAPRGADGPPPCRGPRRHARPWSGDGRRDARGRRPRRRPRPPRAPPGQAPRRPPPRRRLPSRRPAETQRVTAPRAAFLRPFRGPFRGRESRRA